MRAIIVLVVLARLSWADSASACADRNVIRLSLYKDIDFCIKAIALNARGNNFEVVIDNPDVTPYVRGEFYDEIVAPVSSKYALKAGAR